MGSEKRFLPVVLVSLAAVFALNVFFPPEEPAEAKTSPRALLETQDESDAPLAAEGDGVDAQGADAASDGFDAPEAWDKWLDFGSPGEHGYMRVRFDSLGGSVAEIRLGNYYDQVELTDEEKADPEHWVRLVEPAVEAERTLQTLMTRAAKGTVADALLAVEPSQVHWRPEVLEDGVRFVHTDPSGIELVKEIRGVRGENQLRVTLGARTTNEAHEGKTLDLRLVASVGMVAERHDSGYPEPRAMAARPGGDPIEVNVQPKGDNNADGVEFCSGELAYVGTHNKYFAAMLRPADGPDARALTDAVRIYVYDPRWAGQQPDSEDRAKGFRDLLAEGKVNIALPRGGELNSYDYVLYAGPKDKDHFTEGEAGLADVMQEDLGFFDGIASVILGYLRFLHGIVGNWGWAIILLTITVRLLLFPLQRKMQTSMARHATKMKRVQPKLDAIKEKYKDNPKKLREEQGRLFQQEGAMPPVGGCLPIFLQIPIFFGLFSALRVSFDLRHAPFMLWIRDLSEPDHMFRTGLDSSIPLIGDLSWFNLLPILMVVLWIGQQKVMPKPASMSEQQEQMQKIMMWMPIMFGVFLYGYAAGLSLYMITTSTFGIIEATVIRKVWPIDDSEQPKKPSRFMKKLEELQKQAMEMQEQQRRMQAQQQRKGGGKKGR